MKSTILLSIALLIIAGAYSQQSVNIIRVSNPLPAYQPTRTEILQRYKDMMLLDSNARNTVFKARVNANWQAGGNTFWYSNVLKDEQIEYLFVDAVKGTKRPAFDQARLAAALGVASNSTISAG